MIGTRLGHYEILEALGHGGMGVVYRARDTRLERDVALKVLTERLLADERASRQFRKEALALSQLNHPAIAHVYDFDVDQGRAFLVMELVRGQGLADRIEESPLSDNDIALLGKQMADALAAAHREGILHRDVKPGNIRLTTDGRLKLLDFGLAKLRNLGTDASTQTQSQPGMFTGTLPYMAPEQLQGLVADERSDIYAAGAVLYEMACGVRAFPQTSTETLVAAILRQKPVALRRIAPRMSESLQRIVLRCLEKKPSDRYRHASDLAADLDSLRLSPRRRRLLHRVPRGGIAALVAVAAVGVLLVGMLVAPEIRKRAARLLGSSVPSIAVLPLANLSADPDQEYFADGITDELISRLGRLSGLRVVSRTSSMQYKGQSKAIPLIAKELRVGLVVEGSVRRSGDLIRVTTRLIDAVRDRPLWSESFERNYADVLSLESECAQAIVKRIAIDVTPSERGGLARAQTVHPEAHKEVLRGRYQFNQFSAGSFERGIEHFRKAIELDPDYAPAYAGLADTYRALSSVAIPAHQAMPSARVAALRALALDSTLVAARVSLAYVRGFYELNWKVSEAEFRRAIALSPNEASAHQFYGQLLTVSGRFAEAEREISRARVLDPLSSFIGAMELWPLYLGRRYDRAIRAARSFLSADPKNPNATLVLGQALLFKGDVAPGLEAIRSAYRLEPRPITFAWVILAEARAGQRAEAMRDLSQLREMARTVYVQPYTMAVALAGVGESDSMFAYLERALEARSEEMLSANVGPEMDPYRSDPRFRAFHRRLNFPPL